MYLKACTTVTFFWSIFGFLFHRLRGFSFLYLSHFFIEVSVIFFSKHDAEILQKCSCCNMKITMHLKNATSFYLNEFAIITAYLLLQIVDKCFIMRIMNKQKKQKGSSCTCVSITVPT